MGHLVYTFIIYELRANYHLDWIVCRAKLSWLILDKWQFDTVDNSDQNIGIKSLKMKVFLSKVSEYFAEDIKKFQKERKE